MTFGSEQRGICGVCTPANFMTFGSEQHGTYQLNDVRLQAAWDWRSMHACQLNDVPGRGEAQQLALLKTTAQPDLRSGIRPTPATLQNKLSPIQTSLYKQNMPVLFTEYSPVTLSYNFRACMQSAARVYRTWERCYCFCCIVIVIIIIIIAVITNTITITVIVPAAISISIAILIAK